MHKIFPIAALLFGSMAGGAAHAGEPVVLAASGYWKAVTIETDGRAACSIGTFGGGMTVLIAIAADEDDISVRVVKRSWRIPADATVPMSIRFDSQPAWNTVKARIVGDAGTALGYPIAPDSTRDFAHDVTASSVLTISFGGNETPWSVNLMGTSAVWDAFMACGNRINPRVVAQIAAPTQPYNSTVPTQPYEPSRPSRPAKMNTL